MINNISKIINEEINNFDFLGIEETNNRLDASEYLSRPEVQKQFIYDSIKGNNLKITSVDHAELWGNYDIQSLNDSGKFSIDYEISLQYSIHDTNTPIKLKLMFDGEDIQFNVTGTEEKARFDYRTGQIESPANLEAYIDEVFWWSDINVKLLDEYENEINFIELEKSKRTIHDLFIRTYLEEFITNKTQLSLHDNITQSKISKAFSNNE